MKVLTIVAMFLFVLAGSAGAMAVKAFVLDSGDQAFIRRTSLVCAVTQAVGTAKQASCFKVDKAGHPVRGSYGVVIAQNGVAAVRFKVGGQTSVVYQHKQ